ncbi:hypothetical protein MHK_005717, partial [Candidatus Magnetomorum sp. HK-1]
MKNQQIQNHKISILQNGKTQKFFNFLFFLFMMFIFIKPLYA